MPAPRFLWWPRPCAVALLLLTAASVAFGAEVEAELAGESGERLREVPSVVAVLAVDPDEPDGYWPSWRGPHGNGVARGAAPTSWSDDENVRWSRFVGGRGFSTPVIHGDRLILTTAIDLERERSPAPFTRHRDRKLHEQALSVRCLDRIDGQPIWSVRLSERRPHEHHHARYGSYASPSPVTDGEHVWVSFGSLGAACLDLDGEEVWRKDIGPLSIKGQFGEGSSPVLLEDAIVFLCDHRGDSFILALDKRTGDELWRTARDEPTNWSSPLPMVWGGVEQLVTCGTRRNRSYSAATGVELWSAEGMGDGMIPSPICFADTVVFMGGYRNMCLRALRPAHGQDEPAVVRWQQRRGVPYTCQPVLHDGLIFTVKDLGLVSCFDAATGEACWSDQRLPRGTQVKASPIVAGGALYIATEEGDVHVLAAGREFELLASNSLEGASFISSPVVADGRLYLRDRKQVYCISDDPEGE